MVKGSVLVIPDSMEQAELSDEKRVLESNWIFNTMSAGSVLRIFALTPVDMLPMLIERKCQLATLVCLLSISIRFMVTG